jgi:Na+/H+-dicarboxylate symporter
MLKVTGYVMNFAPFAVFGAIAAMVAKEGSASSPLWHLHGQFYLALGCLWLLLIAMGSLFIRRRILTLLALIREPILLAFSTASSEAAYPKTLDRLEKFGCDKRIASFVLPMGYSFNLDGSMMYCTFAVMFIAQAYGIELHGPADHHAAAADGYFKGMAGVPRASLVVIAATLNQFHIRKRASCCCSASTTSSTWGAPPPTCWATPSPRAWWPRAKTAWVRPPPRRWTPPRRDPLTPP